VTCDDSCRGPRRANPSPAGGSHRPTQSKGIRVLAERLARQSAARPASARRGLANAPLTAREESNR
jgi:hypothetical protein